MVCHYSLINRNDTLYYRIQNKKYVKGYGFLSFVTNLSDKCGKKLLDTTMKTGLDAAKTAAKKVVHKTVGAAGEFIGNKIAEKVMKPKPMPDENSRNVEEIVIP